MTLKFTELLTVTDGGNFAKTYTLTNEQAHPGWKLTIRTIGDVHLGRQFKTGVPLHRLGEREELVWKDLETQLNDDAGEDINLQVGDLFDSRVVPPEVVLRVAHMYRQAARRSHVTFIILRGNHDVSRDTEQRSSFDLLEVLLADVHNIHVVSEPRFIGSLACLPYHAFRSAREQAELLLASSPTTNKNYIAVGHWDLEAFGHSEFNLIPAAYLSTYCTAAITGHIHTASVQMIEGLVVHGTGSMQPYSHAEDRTGQWYVTVPYDQLGEPEEYLNKNLRVLIPEDKRDSVVLPEIDCLSLTVKYIGASGLVDNEEVEVKLEEFDIRHLFTQALAENEVPEDVMEIVLGKFDELKV